MLCIVSVNISSYTINTHVLGAWLVRYECMSFGVIWCRDLHEDNFSPHLHPVLITHTDGSRGSTVFTTVCVFVCLSVNLHDISKTNAAGNIKLDIYSTMILGNSFNFGSSGQRSRSWVTITVPAWVFALLWVLASSSVYACSHLITVTLLHVHPHYVMLLCDNFPPILNSGD